MRFINAVLAASILLVLPGCKLGGPVRMDPTALAYTQSENLVAFDQPKQKLIRVAQIEDKRDSREIKGDSPASWNFLLASWRIGDYITGDKAWSGGGGTVSQAVTSSLTDCLKKTNFFTTVQQENSADVSGGQGLILKGQIDSFYASQHLDEYRYEFLVYSRNKDELSSPAGHCKLTYILVDAETNQELKRNTVEAEVKDNKISIVEAGQKALSQADSLVANEVTTRALLE